MKIAEDLSSEQEKLRYQRTLQGLEDVDAGKTISHDAVEAWVEGLATDRLLPAPACGS